MQHLCTNLLRPVNDDGGGQKSQRPTQQSPPELEPNPAKPVALVSVVLLPPRSTIPDNHRLPFGTIGGGRGGQSLATLTIVRPLVRRRLSFLTEDANGLEPGSSRTVEASARCFRRPESSDNGTVQNKRGKLIERSPTKPDTIAMIPEQTLHQEPLPTNDERIMSAVSRSDTEPDLIGDCTVPYILPMVNGRHQDLKYISDETMARLLHGEFGQQVASYEIIDCRFPYEFDGGHIRGAKNLYTREQITKQLLDQRKPEQPATIGEPHGQGSGGATRRHILVFHCEFSVQRGPTLSRFLRNHDRNLNIDRYPVLHYPEVYLLHGGYKKFFTSYSSLCDPITYRPMRDGEYANRYRYFRAILYSETLKLRSQLMR
ncbi:M-phase inducer phosphatase-like [Anopheles cruzii]|uniref:M-phase inducer phosphatase-like n=1 Tax=Anopheles cruzii TaxID=68878 RepID=UPI0022EC27D1|nr:M-phase inducer phosphatase-like [Anopheles cruzii]